MRRCAVVALLVSCRPESTPTVDRDAAYAPDAVDVPTVLQPAPIVACDRGMVRVQGRHCSSSEHRCVKWLDPPSTPELFRRCLEYAPADACRSNETDLDFCIDRYEHRDYGTDLPSNWTSWTVARETCEAESKRLCTDPEWTLACEGPERLPFPYGRVRDTDGSICNVGYGPDELIGANGKMRDLRHPLGWHKRCVSPYGVYDMVGNVGEWTVIPDGHAPFRAAGKGGWWSVGLRSRCRPTTYGHDEHYSGVQVGFRCCDETNRRR